VDSIYTPGEVTTAPPLGRCVITDGRVSHLIGIAYKVPMWSIKDAPDWVIAGDERYTIQAKAEAPASTEQQLLQMLQSLLADRFQLRFHREAKDMPGLALTVGKKGAKLKQTASSDTGVSFGAQAKLGPGQPITVALRRYSMQKLVEFLSNMYLAPMVDETRLTGLYDIDLSWDESAGPTLATAVEEQLGLHLTPQKIPVSFFMFESAQRPTETSRTEAGGRFITPR
jgi:uncharacterized protein (TIGR03435 family)